MKKIKIEIKNKWTGIVLFEYEKENNTIKDTVVEAIKGGADLSGANLREAYLRGADLSEADLSGADLSGADLSEADLSGADLSGANLREAYLRGADLSGADLSGANLREAYLRGANLREAYLRGANLREAYLSGANLREAYLREANLRGAYLSVSDNDIDEQLFINQFEENANVKIKETYINHDIYPTRWNCFWKNGLIIRDWEIKKHKKEIKEMTVEEISEALGYEIKIIKGNDK